MIDLILTDNNAKAFEQALAQEMEKPVKHFERELVGIRSGRAHPSLVEDLMVSCYGGAAMRLRDIASISTPEARLIVIQPWDMGVLNDIEKALKMSELGVTPVNDGTLIRITIQEMSTQRREELVKILRRKLEDAKVAIRNVRKEFHNLIRDSLKNKTISEDHSRRLTDLLQAKTDSFAERCDGLADKKEKDIITI
jgi:ribosome recycling factor